MSRNRAPAIVGIADVVPRKNEEVSYWHQAAELAMAALHDAGLTVRDVDGVVFEQSGYAAPFTAFSTDFCQYLGIGPAWIETQPHGGAQTGAQLFRAAAGIRAGYARTVLIVCSDNRKGRFSRSPLVGQLASQHMHSEFEVPYGPLIPSAFALIAQRHMYEYGTTSEEFAQVAVTARKWSAMNPAATMREPLTIEDVLSSRMISSPLHLLDICLVTDGGGAAVVVDGDRAGDFPKQAVSILGTGDCGESQHISFMPDLLHTTMWRRAAETALHTAGVGLADIDVAYIYDAATAEVIWVLEQIGFCKPGEAAGFVAEGHTAPGGSFPINTHGGLLAHAHPGSPGGFLGIVEMVRQLRGECGERQVPGAELALTTSAGGMMTVGVNVLGRAR
jgi:acetyl-CoA acetyltransferase